MQIKNIELCNDSIRLTKALSLNSKTVEQSISVYPYNGEHLNRDPFVENILRMPPMIFSFYSFIFENNRIPSENEFIDNYLLHPFFRKITKDSFEVEHDGKTHTVKKESLCARILRTYPSLIRDFHFYCMAKESGLFEMVYYSCKDDYYNKVDIAVKLNGKLYNLGLLLESQRSGFFLEKKQLPSRHKDSPEVIYIRLSKTNCKKCGRFWLYSESHVKDVFDYLSKNQMTP